MAILPSMSPVMNRLAISNPNAAINGKPVIKLQIPATTNSLITVACVHNHLIERKNGDPTNCPKGYAASVIPRKRA